MLNRYQCFCQKITKRPKKAAKSLFNLAWIFNAMYNYYAGTLKHQGALHIRMEKELCI